METIRVGVLGFAHGHVGTYCSRWREQPELGIKVTAGWDHDASRRAQACKDHGIEAADSVQALLGREGIDAVVIGAETSMHADLVEHPKFLNPAEPPCSTLHGTA